MEQEITKKLKPKNDLLEIQYREMTDKLISKEDDFRESQKMVRKLKLENEDLKMDLEMVTAKNGRLGFEVEDLTRQLVQGV